MNPGGEPERDDTGLPPVDIEIPDDARELDRDVQAYYREQRALRRQQRRSRLHGLLAKDGIVLPLLACCLILALITGTLLTVFTAASNQGYRNLPGAGATNPAVRTAVSAQPLTLQPDASVQVGSTPVRLQSLSRAMLVLLPANCRCRSAVAGLAQLAANAGAKAYLISSPSQPPEASQLARQVNGGHHASVAVAVDSGDALGRYQNGLTAIVVGPDHAAHVAMNLAAGQDLIQLQSLLTR